MASHHHTYVYFNLTCLSAPKHALVGVLDDQGDGVHVLNVTDDGKGLKEAVVVDIKVLPPEFVVPTT